jgi:NIMA (never in mitosis gene a)-related kinase
MVFNTKLLDNYNIIKIVGRGAFGTVEQIQHKLSKEYFALKTVYAGTGDTTTSLLNEINIMKKNNSKYLIKVIDWTYDENKLCIIMEWAPNGDLETLINRKKELNEPIDSKIIDKIIFQTCCAIKELHDNNILHRDIKPSNILVFDDNNIKLADFGVSKLIYSKEAYTQIGTPYYMSPELINGYSYTFSSDYWALGCVYYQLITLEKPFIASNIIGLFLKINSCKYNLKKIPYKYRKLVENLIKINKHTRYNHKDIFAFYSKKCY